MKLFNHLFLFLFCTSSLISQVYFSEESESLGLNGSSYGLGEFGGGISFFDFNKDGFDDLTVSSESGDPIRFYRNNGSYFTEITLELSDPEFETKTVQWVDFDNDGDFDLFATSNIDSNRLYENNGNMEFNDITSSANLIVSEHKTYGSSWGDFNNDGLLDLFICSRDPDSTINYNILYKNNGNNTFTNVSDISGISLINHISFCAGFFDYNNDGWQDIFIANDRIPVNQLYKNNGDETFTEVGAEAGINESINAMSTTIGDYNNDGWLDIYITNTIEGNIFYKNNANGTFTDIAPENGTLFESAAWGAVFLDAENDKDIDLYVSGALDGTTSFLPSAFYENQGDGNYLIPSTAGFNDDTAWSFSNAIGDINNNGFPDITVLNHEPDDVFLWKNISNQNNNWLKVKLEGVISNRQGIGSWIEISIDGIKQYNYTLCGEGFLGQNSAYEFFGLGSASSVDYIKVTWLSGQVDLIENPSINSHITILEGGELGMNVNHENNLLVYPNPGKKFHVKINNFKEKMILYVTDVTGKILFNTLQQFKDMSIDLSEFSSGVYFLNIFNDSQKFTKKLIIN